MTILTVSEPQELDQIMDEVHDKWFDLDAITYVEADREFALAYGRKATRKESREGAAHLVVEGELRIAHAIACEVEDKAQIGYYDLNEVTYDPDARAIVLTSSFPLRITIAVSAIEVAVLLAS
jgi:hypothetical protein